MKSQPIISVVTPVYNGARFLDQCIQSVRSQTYENWEHIIVDNASTDETPKIIEIAAAQDARIRVFRNAETVDALENHNIAVTKRSPQSSYCKILHADDQLLPTCLEKMVAVAQANPSVGLVGSYSYSAKRLKCTGLPVTETFFTGKDVVRRTLLGESYPFWSPSCLMHRNETLAEREKFYSSDRLDADVECSYEILRKWDFGFVHEPLTIIAMHEASRTSTLAKPMKRLMAYNLELLTRFGPEVLSPDELEQQFQRRIDHYYKTLARSAFELHGSSFWRFHRQALQDAGHNFSAIKLSAAIASRFASAPLRQTMRVARALQRG